MISTLGHKRKAPQILLCSLIVAPLLQWRAAGPVYAERERSGFTLEVSSRLGSFLSFQFDGDNVLEPAVTPLALSIGGFVSDRVALFGSASAAFFKYSPRSSDSAESRLKTSTTRSLFLGMTVQLWLTPSWTLGTGIGLSTISHGPLEAEVNRGLAIPVRLGWLFGNTGGASWGVTWDLAPSFYSRGETTLNSTIGLQWQWL